MPVLSVCLLTSVFFPAQLVDRIDGILEIVTAHGGDMNGCFFFVMGLVWFFLFSSRIGIENR